jgi:hypothetical protein
MDFLRHLVIWKEQDLEIWDGNGSSSLDVKLKKHVEDI